MHRTSRLIRTGLVAGLLALAVAVPPTASAAPLVREHYSGTDTFSFDDCGFWVDGSVVFDGVFVLKQGRAGDPTPYFFDNYHATETLTNRATGDWLTIEHQGLYKDLKIELGEGTIYAFTAIEVGRPFVVTDSDGNVVILDRGLLKTRFLVDTLGDDNLDNDIFIDDSWSLLKDAGSHPGFYIDFCEVLTDTIG